ncbi:MAG: Rap1a/Tai family immunity protein, partial [Kiloniellales bacterium]|nr:Rap1a/Tai family immunity protein [Kiloniellales bacterium]
MLALLLMSGPALSGEESQEGSSLLQSDLVGLCHPDAVGETQLYCRYYMMGLIDGLAVTSSICLPNGSSSEQIWRLVYASMSADPSQFHQQALKGVRSALAGAFP